MRKTMRITTIPAALALALSVGARPAAADPVLDCAVKCVGFALACGGISPNALHDCPILLQGCVAGCDLG